MTSHLLLVTRALAGVETLPPATRADLYDAAADVLTALPTDHPDLIEACRSSALHLREAEASQMRLLLTLASDSRLNA